ncbi:flagellar hook-associated protein FlgK [Ilumatobacter sp.]|uniref:flagellar hook-associated protein FlgK n=1 Tax=Ilumatobacter sp. TaxID=1967498 RepID=UPI003B51BDB8
MISGLYTALSGMNAHRKILDVTSHNVANQATPGYHRQRVDLAPSGIGAGAAIHTGADSQLLGVDIVGTTRVLDAFAEQRALREQASAADASATAQTMTRLETVFPEPTEFGIAAQLDEFWSSWGDLASRPDNETARTAVLGQAKNLTETLGRAAADVDRVAEGASARLDAIAGEVNDLTGRIARLNLTVASSSNGSNDVLDQRDRLVTRLTELTGATVRPGVGEQVNISLGGRALVTGPLAEEVVGGAGSLRWARDASPIAATTGEVAALRRLVGDTLPGYRAELDEIARSLVEGVNDLHSTGFDLDGGTGWTFFDPAATTAETIRLSDDVAGQPRRVAAGAPVLPGPVAPGIFDGGIAERLASMADSASGPDQRYRSMVTRIGIETGSALRRDETQSIVARRAIDDVDSVSGVSIDEEMVSLIQAQRGYEANARVLTAIDQLMGVIIERTGLVGR